MLGVKQEIPINSLISSNSVVTENFSSAAEDEGLPFLSIASTFGLDFIKKCEYYDFSKGIEYYVSTNSVFEEGFYLYRDEPHLRITCPMPKDDYSSIIKVREQTPYEIIEFYTDSFPLLEIRRSIMRLKSSFAEVCTKIITWPFFEFLVITVILLNTIALAVDDSTSNTRLWILYYFDYFFLVFYTTECLMKIISTGFILTKRSYLRDSWNILDFTIVVTAWVDFLFGNSIKLQALRALRVLRPLRSISSISGLRVIFLALVSSIKPLIAAMTLFIFLIAIFAIAGLQLWSGVLKYRCLNLETGIIDKSLVCGGYTCPKDYFCVKSLDNPNYGITNFDNFLFSALSIYQSITLEGWTNIMILTQMGFNDFSIILFIPLVFIGAFIFLNLTLAIIKSAFSKSIVVIQPKETKKVENVDVAVLIKHLSESTEWKSNNRSGISDDSLIENSGLPMIVENKWGNEENAENASDVKRGAGSEGLLFVQDIKDSYLTPKDTKERSSAVKSRSNLSQDSCPKETIYKPRHRTTKTFKENLAVATTLLARMNKTLKLNKSVSDKIKDGERLQHVVFNVFNYDLITTSKKHVLNENPLLIRENFELSSERFVYYDRFQENERIINKIAQSHKKKLSKFKKVNRAELFFTLRLKYGNKSAFFIVFPQVSEAIKQQETDDMLEAQIVGSWSGFDVNQRCAQVLQLTHSSYYVWKSGFFGFIEFFTFPLEILIKMKIFNIFMTICIAANTVVLSLDSSSNSTETQANLIYLNAIFTNIFIAEMGLKIIALGIVGYCRDIMNYFDGSIVILSIIETIFLNNTKSAFTAFRVVRVFRILRVLRVARLFRYLRSMSHILKILSKSMSKFIYLFMLLLLFLVIYSLIGMQIFGGELNFSKEPSRSNFDTFHWSFTTTFQVLSLENWQSVLYDGMRSSAGYASCIYFISWILLGNYVILNLFLAILLDSFSEHYNEESSLEASVFTRQPKHNKKREEKIRIIENLVSESDEEANSATFERKSLIDPAFQGRSFFVFSTENRFRSFCIMLYTSNKFEIFILVLISITSFKLAIDTYITNSSTYNIISSILDFAFTSCFFAEFIVKTVCLGFIIGEKSYLKDKWNYIDFIIVMISAIDLAVSDISISQFKILRLLRTLRPLRYISHNMSMKVVVTALLESLFAIFNVAVVLIIVWLMFAILGVSLFGGNLNKCSNALITTKSLCLTSGYSWTSESPNFDNVVNAMVTLFILSSEEGWPDIMDRAIDARDPNQAPSTNYNPYAAYYFIVFIMISSFFFMNLFTAVVFEKFTEAKKSQTSLAASILTKDQMTWIELQHLIITSSPNIDFSSKPVNKFRGLLYSISKSSIFKIAIMLVIVLNMIQMSILYDGASLEYLQALDTMNLVFTSIFIIEAFIKITGVGFRNYYQNGSNKFDLIVVITSVLDIILTYSVNSTISLLRIGPQMIRIIRVLRVSRLVRLFKSLDSLKRLIDIIGYSLPAIINVISLLMLVFYIYAILGVNLFSSVTSGNIIGRYANFSNFGNAILILFRCSTGEDWYSIMYDSSSANNMIISGLYFISFITITTFIMLNLFIMVIIQNYEEHETNPESILRIFTKEVRKIKTFWSIYAKDSSGSRVHYSDLPLLMQELEELGVSKEMEVEQIMKILRFTELTPDSSGYVYYNDFLFVILRKKYFKRGNSVYYKKLLRREENKSRHIIKKIIGKERLKFENASFQNATIGNFFLKKMFLKSVFKNWKGYTKKRLAKRGKENVSVSVTPVYTEFVDPGENSLRSPSLAKSVPEMSLNCY